jgi:DNA-binding beta-propeller fold protein YncE
MKICNCSIAGLIALWFLAEIHAQEPKSMQRVQTIALKGKAGNLDHLAIDQKRQRLFIANKANNTLDIVDLAAGKLFKQISGQQAIQGLAYAPDLDRIYAGLGGKGLFNIFNGQTYALIGTHKFQDDSDNVRYDPQTRQVFVAHAENSLAVVDADSFAVKNDIKLPGDAEGFQVDGNRLYVAIPTPSQVAVVDAQAGNVTQNYPIKAAETATPLVLDSANKRLFIGCRKPPTLVVMDAGSGKEVATVPIAGEVDDISFDPARKQLYVSCGEGVLFVIRQTDADHYEVTEKIATAPGAKTSLFVPETNRLFLAVPRQPDKPAAEVWIYQLH